MSRPSDLTLLLTCEHASNTLPAFLNPVFAGNEALLRTHRAYDPGAKEVFDYVRKRLHPGFSRAGLYSRLAIDLNRSLCHPALLSSWTCDLPESDKKKLIRIWKHYREAVQKHVQKFFQNAPRTHRLLHLSLHSFTPVLNETVRNAEIGILYDPRRPAEKEFAALWKKETAAEGPQCRVRLNYPYQGKSDGHTTALRREFGPRYLGIEVEMNQAWLAATSPVEVAELLTETLSDLNLL